MLRKISTLIIPIVIVVFLSFLPIFPLIVEMREITQEGESLYQEWRFVSLPEFYDAARFAQSGWLESTWNNYLVLALLNHVGLIVVFYCVRKLLNIQFIKNKSR